MAPRILLVHPPIYDFAAYDFWLRPLGVLGVAGRLRGRAEMVLFDFLDRFDPRVPAGRKLRSDGCGRGEFHSEPADKPAVLADVPRRFRRFGLPREAFGRFLAEAGPFDFALVQTTMTYWYLGVREVIAELRERVPAAKIALGGVYATLCADHARSLGADFVLTGRDLRPLWRRLGVSGDASQPPLWEACGRLRAGAIKLTDGCPFRCTYCSVPQVYGGFRARPVERALGELGLLLRCGAEDVAFYDDALLCDAEAVLVPFLRAAAARGLRARFHTPNALHARLVTRELAERMVEAGFRSFYLGLESASAGWQRRTGDKVDPGEFARAVSHLAAAGAEPDAVTAYVLVGHPDADEQDIEASMAFAHGLGVRVTLAEFSPIPGTPDGDRCGRWVDMSEPLWHNNTAFAWRRLGTEKLQTLKTRCREGNESLGRRDPRAE